jgi:alpha-tubulin suppressor-like RCC1 family protein
VRADVSVGNQNHYVRLTSSNVLVVADTFSVDVTVQNLLQQALGTTDGTTLNAAGVRVFFSVAPTDGVTILNADGTGTFTASNQPYFEYDQVLQPAQISSAKTWRFVLNGATGFTFEVYVNAEVPDPTNIAFALTSISAGIQHACGLDAEGHGYCWGVNTNGRLGDGTTTTRTVPTRVAGGLTFATIRAGQNHTCALTTDGAAYCWGANAQGQVGDGTNIGRVTPTAVAGGHTFIALTAGGNTCGVTTTGAAYCWGFNHNGELGDSTTVNRNTPTPVKGGLTFATIEVGGNNGVPNTFEHTCALTQAGVAYCWGLNSSGELGDSTTTNRLTPTAVSGGLTFTSLTLGVIHTCGLTSSGQAYCWGSNTFGQLGDGPIANQSTPTAVSGGSIFTSLAASQTGNHTCAVITSGDGVCWGSDSSGQLGDGGTTDLNIFAVVSGGIKFASLASGSAFTCGFDNAGVGYCWGANSVGQLGDGTLTSHITPAPLAATR